VRPHIFTQNPTGVDLDWSSHPQIPVLVQQAKGDRAALVNLPHAKPRALQKVQLLLLLLSPKHLTTTDESRPPKPIN